MFGEILDRMVAAVSPLAGARRMQARRIVKRYQGAESNRLTANKNPQNRSADAELTGPFGADPMRSWARLLVRDNAYAWGVVDTIVSSVVGTGIKGQSQMETPDGEDREGINEARDKVWNEFCNTCDVNGQYTFYEMQAIIQREIVEAGECLVHLVDVPLKYRGTTRPVPLALELIEADRLASDRDTYNRGLHGENRIVRGVELDDLGRPVAYHVYKSHPTDPFAFNRDIERIDAKDILHLFKRDRIGQTRGISWFAPVLSWLRDLATYVDNELQASAVASCYTMSITSTRGVTGLGNPSVDCDSTAEAGGNQYDYVQPGIIMHLLDGEKAEGFNPGRPNSAAEPWINLMLRGIAVGTGLSYETVARDYSQTSYSSSRTSQLEDRRRFRRWQRYLIDHFCCPVHCRFNEAAALAGRSEFPTMTEILEDRAKCTAFEWQAQEWEWVDPQNEQSASSAAVKDNQSTHQSEQAKIGKHWRATFKQRAKEESLRKSLGLTSAEELLQQARQPQSAGSSPNIQALALNGAQVTSLVDIVTQVGTGALPHESAKAIISAAFPDIDDETIDQIIDPIEAGSIASEAVPQAATPEQMKAAVDPGSSEWMGLSRLQLKNNRKALADILTGLADGSLSPVLATAQLSMIGMAKANIDALIDDASDGVVDEALPAQELQAVSA